MTTTTTITRPVVTTTDQSGAPTSRRRTVALLTAGILVVGVAVGTTYAIVGQADSREQQPQQLPAVQSIDRTGADAVAFARGTATTLPPILQKDHTAAGAVAAARQQASGH